MGGEKDLRHYRKEIEAEDKTALYVVVARGCGHKGLCSQPFEFELPNDNSMGEKVKQQMKCKYNVWSPEQMGKPLFVRFHVPFAGGLPEEKGDESIKIISLFSFTHSCFI